MGIFLTNGHYYIGYNHTNAIVKVLDIKQAHDFLLPEEAEKLKAKATKKCAGFYWINTDNTGIRSEETPEVVKNKRRNFSLSERTAVYRKTKGCCYLCGEFVDFDSFEIEHKLPLSKGGTNDIGNLFCSCHTCNTMKGDMPLSDFMKQGLKIFLRQMGRKNSGKLKWKLIEKELKKLI